MKFILFIASVLLCNLAVAQLSIPVEKDKIKEAKVEYGNIKYVEVYPKEMLGTYSRTSDNNRNGASWTTEVSITLEANGILKTKTYKSVFAGRPAKTIEVLGKWGIALDKDTLKPFIEDREGKTYYKIVVMSNDGGNLAYYDRPAYYDYVILDGNDAFLKLIFSDKGMVPRL